MNANQLIELVEKEKENDWENSDIGAFEEGTLETITDHFKTCEDCRNTFDSMNYPETILLDFSFRISNSNSIYDWICDN